MMRTIATWFIPLAASALSEPLSSSWFTDLTGQDARIYPSTKAQTAGTFVTSWDPPIGEDQLTSTYAGISEISVTNDEV